MKMPNEDTLVCPATVLARRGRGGLRASLPAQPGRGAGCSAPAPHVLPHRLRHGHEGFLAGSARRAVRPHPHAARAESIEADRLARYQHGLGLQVAGPARPPARQQQRAHRPPGGWQRQQLQPGRNLRRSAHRQRRGRADEVSIAAAGREGGRLLPVHRVPRVGAGDLSGEQRPESLRSTVQGRHPEWGSGRSRTTAGREEEPARSGHRRAARCSLRPGRCRAPHLRGSPRFVARSRARALGPRSGRASRQPVPGTARARCNHRFADRGQATDGRGGSRAGLRPHTHHHAAGAKRRQRPALPVSGHAGLQPSRHLAQQRGRQRNRRQARGVAGADRELERAAVPVPGIEAISHHGARGLPAGQRGGALDATSKPTAAATPEETCPTSWPAPSVAPSGPAAWSTPAASPTTGSSSAWPTPWACPPRPSATPISRRGL